MKKKLLTIFAVLAVVVAMVFSVVACGGNGGGNKKPQTPEDPTPPAGPTMAQKVKTVTDNVGNGLSRLMSTIGSASTTGKSIDATIALAAKIGEDVDVNVDLRVAATFGDESKALVEATVQGTPYVSLYVNAAGDVYLGEALMQDTKAWYKLEGLSANKVLGAYFPQLVPMLSKKDLLGSMGGLSSLGGMMGLVGNILNGLGDTTNEASITEETVDGLTRYAMKIDFSKLASQIPSIMNLVSMFGGSSEGGSTIDVLKGLLGDYYGIVDTVVNIIFGGNIEALVNGTIDTANAPDVRLISRTRADSTLADFGISYKNAGLQLEEGMDPVPVEVSFMLKDVQATNNSATKLLASEPTAKQVGLKATVDLGTGLIQIGEEPAKTNLGAKLTVEFAPKIKITEFKAATYKEVEKVGENGEAEKNEKGETVKVQVVDQPASIKLDMSGTIAHVTATLPNGTSTSLACKLVMGDWQPKASETDKWSYLYIDFAGLYAIAGMTAPQESAPHTKFKVGFAFGGVAQEDAPAQDVQSAPVYANAVDTIFDFVQSAMGGNFNISGVFDLLTPLKDVITSLGDSLKTCVTKITGGVSLDLSGMLNGIVKNDLLKNSEKLTLKALADLFSDDANFLSKFNEKTANVTTYLVGQDGNLSADKIIEFIKMFVAENYQSNVSLEWLNTQLSTYAPKLKITLTDDFIKAGGVVIELTGSRENGVVGFTATLKIKAKKGEAETATATLLDVLKIGATLQIVDATTITDNVLTDIGTADYADWDDGSGVMSLLTSILSGLGITTTPSVAA